MLTSKFSSLICTGGRDTARASAKCASGCEETLADKVHSLRGVRLSVNDQVPPGSRSFHKDWFDLADIPDQLPGKDVLLIDDT